MREILKSLLVYPLVLTSLALCHAVATAPANFIILGDSITAGYELPTEEAYPSLLQDKIDARGWPIDVINAGVSGDTSAGGLRRIQWLMRANFPDIVMIALGGNDGLRGLPTAGLRQNLRATVQAIRSVNADAVVILAGMQMPESMGADFAAEFAESYETVADSENTHLFSFLLRDVAGRDDLNLPDRIHPNTEGHEIIAENLWSFLDPLFEDFLNSR